MLNDIASNTSFFGIFITGVVYVLACAIQKRFKSVSYTHLTLPTN